MGIRSKSFSRMQSVKRATPQKKRKEPQPQEKTALSSFSSAISKICCVVVLFHWIREYYPSSGENISNFASLLWSCKDVAILSGFIPMFSLTYLIGVSLGLNKEGIPGIRKSDFMKILVLIFLSISASILLPFNQTSVVVQGPLFSPDECSMLMDTYDNFPWNLNDKVHEGKDVYDEPETSFFARQFQTFLESSNQFISWAQRQNASDLDALQRLQEGDPLSLKNVPEVFSTVETLLQLRLRRLLAHYYKGRGQEGDMQVADVFLQKYDGDKMNGASAPLSFDKDGHLSLHVVLSSPDHFDGGEFFFSQHADTKLKLPQGHALIHPAKMYHSRQAVEGVMYTLDAVFYIRPNDRFRSVTYLWGAFAWKIQIEEPVDKKLLSSMNPFHPVDDEFDFGNYDDDYS